MHTEKTRRARVDIDLDAIRYNYFQLKKQASDSHVIAVIKADAYGHGAIEVAKSLPDADAFAVASVGEAVELRKADIKQKILVLGGFINLEESQQVIEYSLDPVIHQQWHIDLIAQNKNAHQLEVWVKIDTGMGRLGFEINAVPKLLLRLESLKLKTIRLISHLANADVPDNTHTRSQLEKIKQIQQDYEWSIANSAGIQAWPDSHKNWVRAGISLYGADPFLTDHSQLKPAMTFRAPVMAINSHKAGDTIGYASLYTCKEDKQIAVISAGYADGYPRCQLSQSQVQIRGRNFAIVGRVSMDMITVDITGADDIEIGDQVILWGQNPTVDSIAKNAQTISYELLCNAGHACKREYLKKEK